jgi:transposase
MEQSSTHTPLERRRLLAVDLLSKGLGVCETARKANLSVPTVRKYKALLETDGAHAITGLRVHGQRPKLSSEQQNWLISAIKHSPRLHGFDSDVWTVEQLSILVRRQLGVTYSESHIARFVRDRELTYRLPRAAARASTLANKIATPGEAIVARRATAIELLLKGESAENIAQKLKIAVGTVKGYAAAIDAGGLDALRRMGSTGRRASLNAEALAWLTAALKQKPPVHGFKSGLWRNRDIQLLIERQFGVRHSNGYVREVVDKLGMSHRMRPARPRTEKKRCAMNAETRSWIAAVLKHSPQIQEFISVSAYSIHADMSGKSRLASGLSHLLARRGELMSKGSRQFVPDVPNLDNEAWSELLTYLVVSQLVGRSRTEGRLTPVHLAESEWIWLMANGGRCGWADRLRLAKMSVAVAGTVWQPSFPGRWLPGEIFLGWLATRLPVIARTMLMLDVCRRTVPDRGVTKSALERVATCSYTGMPELGGTDAG